MATPPFLSSAGQCCLKLRHTGGTESPVYKLALEEDIVSVSQTRATEAKATDTASVAWGKGVFGITFNLIK